MTDFQSAFYRDVQPFSGGWTFLLGSLGQFSPPLPPAFAVFQQKFQLFSAVFRMFSIFLQPISRWLRGFFVFPGSFQFVFKFSILYLFTIRRISTMSIIIGIDHGYYAIKTEHCSFPAGLTSYGEHEPYHLAVDLG